MSLGRQSEGFVSKAITLGLAPEALLEECYGSSRPFSNCHHGSLTKDYKKLIGQNK